MGDCREREVGSVKHLLGKHIAKDNQHENQDGVILGNSLQLQMRNSTRYRTYYVELQQLSVYAKRCKSLKNL